MELIEQSTAGNHLITSLQEQDFYALQPHLQRVRLSLRATLHKSGEQISAVFFPNKATSRCWQDSKTGIPPRSG